VSSEKKTGKYHIIAKRQGMKLHGRQKPRGKKTQNKNSRVGQGGRTQEKKKEDIDRSFQQATNKKKEKRDEGDL